MTAIPASDNLTDRHRVDALVNMVRKQGSEPMQDRRSGPRFALQMPVKLGVCLAGSDEFSVIYDAWALDISSHGVGLILEDPSPPLLKLFIDFSSVMGEQFLLPARILYCRELLPHTYQAGAVFMWMAQ